MTFATTARKIVASYAPIRRALDGLRFVRLYGTWSPTRIRLQHSGNYLFVNFREPRGRSVLKCGAEGQPLTKSIWRAANERLRPTIVIDVGLNYGEFLFDENYEAEATLIGVEANPQLRTWLERSAEAHPSREQIRLVFALASDRAEGDLPFFIDPDSSGRSSALRSDAESIDSCCRVPSTTIDALVEHLDDQQLSNGRLLFKIDVEGFEPFVLGGMSRLLRHVGQAVGIVECNSALLRKANIDPQQYLATLAERFPVVIAQADGQLRRLPKPTWQALSMLVQGRDFETDLVLVSSEALFQELGLARFLPMSPTVSA